MASTTSTIHSDGTCTASSLKVELSRAADDVRKPVKNSSESPGKKKPTSRPDSAKMIVATPGSAARPAFSNHHSGFRNSANPISALTSPAPPPDGQPNSAGQTLKPGGRPAVASVTPSAAGDRGGDPARAGRDALRLA